MTQDETRAYINRRSKERKEREHAAAHAAYLARKAGQVATPVQQKDVLQAIYAQAPVAVSTSKVCRVCRQIGIAGQYPFSTIAHGSVCDDCL